MAKNKGRKAPSLSLADLDTPENGVRPKIEIWDASEGATVVVVCALQRSKHCAMLKGASTVFMQARGFHMFGTAPYADGFAYAQNKTNQKKNNKPTNQKIRK